MDRDTVKTWFSKEFVLSVSEHLTSKGIVNKACLLYTSDFFHHEQLHTVSVFMVVNECSVNSDTHRAPASLHSVSVISLNVK